jgi:hypothetical protein
VKLVGAGPELDYLQQKLRNVSSQVEFTGWLSGKELDEAYRWSDYVVAPSYTESFGIVPLEAMKHKRPVIATNTDAFKELYIDTKTSIPIKFDRNNFAKEISKTLTQVLSERKQNTKKFLIDSMVSRAFEMVKHKYTWDTVAGLTRAMYDSIPVVFPDVSVILPVLGDSPHVDECITSLLNQTHKNYEIIIVADQHNLKSMQNYKNKQVRVCYSADGDIVNAKNTGLSAARGKYITFMDQKDLATESRLEVLANALDKKKDAGLVHAKSVSRNAAGLQAQGNIDKYFSPIHTKKRFTKKDLLNGSFINASTVMMRKEALQRVKGYRGPAKIMEYDLWIRLAEIINFEFIDDVVTFFKIDA